MIEAVKSTLSVAPLVQKSLDKASNARSFAANPQKLQEVAVSSDDGLYVSRNVRLDNTSKIAVLEFRNPLNGDVKTQIPTEAQLEAYEREALAEAVSLLYVNTDA